jgi:arylsulfatase A-like enzyme
MHNPDDMEVPISLNDAMENTAYSNKGTPEGYDDPTKVKRWTASYFGLISEVDEWVGKILDKLDELGIAENTLLAFSSDHGEMLGGHGA